MPIIIPVSSFYDRIAQEYNRQLDTARDERVRRYVADIFTRTVFGESVLDFGGGTGLDTPWLTKHYNRVYFLEPSSQMRNVAMKGSPQTSGKNILFIEDNLDFNRWSSDHLPFQEKVDGILANFAVVNCIADISLLFEKISLVSKPGGYFLCTVLNVRRFPILKNYPFRTFIKALLGRTPEISNNYKGFGHLTYLHSIRSLKNFSKEYFHWIQYIPIKNSPFALVVLKKK